MVFVYIMGPIFSIWILINIYKEQKSSFYDQYTWIYNYISIYVRNIFCEKSSSMGSNFHVGFCIKNS